MAVTYLRLFDPTQQFQLKNGAINVAGLLKIKLEGTDDYAPVFDEDGTQLAQPVILDNNGRSKGLFVDASKVYWLEVDDRDGYELFTIRKMTPCGGGGGSTLGGKYEVVSSDGTVSVERYDDGGITYFDLSTALTNQAATWGATFATANAISGDDNWEMLPVVTSAGTSQWNNGWTASKDCVADIAASLEMDGDSVAISTVDVMCVFTVDGTGVSTEYSQLDPSDSRGKVSFEYKGELLEGQVVDCRIFVKSVETMSPALVAKAYFNEECDGIIGGGGGNYTAGDFVEITSAKVINVTGVQPLSGMSAYATQSAFDDCCSAMSGYVSSLSSQVSSLETSVTAISSTVSGLTGTYVEISSISSYSSIWNSASAVPNKLDESAFTAYTATSTAGDFTGVRTDSSLTGNGMPGSALGVNGMELVFDSSMETSISGNSAIVGVGTAITSGFIPASESGNFILTSQSGAFQPSGNYVSSSDMSGFVEVSSISGASSTWNSASAISSKLDESAFTAYTATATAGGFSGVTTDSSLTGNGTPESALGVNGMELVFDSSMSTSISGGSAIVGVDTAITSGFIPTSESGNFILTSQSGAFQPSGNYVSSSDMSGYVDASSISAASSVWNSASSISSMMPWSSLEGDGTSITAISGSAIGGTGTGGKTYSGIAPVIVDNDADTISLSSKELVFSSPMSAVDSGNSAIVSINLSAYALSSDVSGVIDTVSTNSASWGGGGGGGDYVEKSATEVAIGSANTATETSMAQGKENSAYNRSFAQGFNNSASSRSFAQGAANRATFYSFAQGGANSASSFSFAQGNFLSAKNTAAAFGQYNLRGDGDTSTGNSAAFVIGDGIGVLERHDLMVVTKNGEITLFSSTADTTGTGIMSSLRHISANYQPSGDYIYASSLGTGTI